MFLSVFIAFSLAFLWTLLSLGKAVKDWRVVHALGQNGVRQTLAFARVRIRLVRLLTHGLLLMLLFPRTWLHTTHDPSVAAFLFLSLAFILIVDAAADAYDFYLISWFNNRRTS